jgi:hypothetical protein
VLLGNTEKEEEEEEEEEEKFFSLLDRKLHKDSGLNEQHLLQRLADRQTAATKKKAIEMFNAHTKEASADTHLFFFFFFFFFLLYRKEEEEKPTLPRAVEKLFI